MALTAAYLAEKNALARMPVAAVRRRLEPLLVEGLVVTCGVIDLEIGYSARNADTHTAVRRERQALPRATLDDLSSTARWRCRGCLPAAASTGCPSLISSSRPAPSGLG